MTMTPAALSAYRVLRTLDLPDAIIRKVRIAADGRPCFAALDDNEFDVVKRNLKRKYPTYANLVWQEVMDAPTGPQSIPLHPQSTTH